jgi:uncharacterized protein with PIN domain
VSKVVAMMNTCSKTHTVHAALNEDGSVRIDIESDCEKIIDLSKRLKYVTIDDVTNFHESRLTDKEIRCGIGFCCLVFTAVTQAAWMELGMLSEGHAKKVKCNMVSYE